MFCFLQMIESNGSPLSSKFSVCEQSNNKCFDFTFCLLLSSTILTAVMGL